MAALESEPGPEEGEDEARAIGQSSRVEERFKLQSRGTLGGDVQRLRCLEVVELIMTRLR